MGKLIRALYRTRDAPLAWQTVVRSDMKMLGFKECKATNGVFTHGERDLRVVAHVDDFLVSGEHHDLLWFRDRLPETYELKVQIAGWEHADDREVGVLSRVIRITLAGIELEGDDKHVEILEEEWGVDNCKTVATPYVKLTGSIPRPVGAGGKRHEPGGLDFVSSGRGTH